MVSLFSIAVTGAQVPATDVRLMAHIDAPAVVTAAQGPAAPTNAVLALVTPILSASTSVGLSILK